MYISTLDALLDGWKAHGWPADVLHGFTMKDPDPDDPPKDPDPDPDPDPDDPPKDPDPDDPPLGPKGESALAAEKDKRRAAQGELREWKALGLTPAEIKALVAATKKDDAPDPESIKAEAKAEAQREVLSERLLDKIEAKAGTRFSIDPEDVAALLMRRHTLDDFLDDGKLDVEAISDALEGLLTKSPNLAAQGGRKFQGGGDGGPRTETRAKQLSRADLKSMNPEQIEKARESGQLADLLSGKT